MMNQPIPPAPQPSMMASRPLQLDQWANTKAPLTTNQRASVNRLAEWLHKNSPEYKSQHHQPQSKLRQQQAATTHPSSASALTSSNGTHSGNKDALQRQDLDDPSFNKKKASTSTSALSSLDLPDATAPLTSAQDFLAWYTSLTDSITSSTQSSHTQALRRISDATAFADSLLSRLESCQVNVSELRAGTAFVQDSSKGLRQEAQALLDAQLHLDSLSEEITSRLSFFTLLPYATTMLSSPDSSIVFTQEFLDLMDQLEVALLFLQQHPASNYKDAALYRMRYAQCVTRAATLAKLAITRELKNSADAAQTKLKQLQNKSTSQPADVKGKSKEISPASYQDGLHDPISPDQYEVLFAEPALLVPKLRPLIFELEKRAQATENTTTIANASTAPEHDSLLQECKIAWFTHRKPILARLILLKVLEIETSAAQQPDSQFTATEELSRLGSAVLSWFLNKEIELYHQFFAPLPTAHQDAPNVQDAPSKVSLESDPKLQAYLTELSESLISKLRPRIQKENDIETLARISAAAATSFQSGHSASSLLAPLLQETNVKLVSRAQSLLASEVAGFYPREENQDLDFPERILAYKGTLLSASAANDREAGETTLAFTAGKTSSHRRGKSGAGLLDAALSASTPSSSRIKGDKVELFTLPAALSSTYYTPIVTLLNLLYHLQARLPASTFHQIAEAGVSACQIGIGKGAEALLKRKKGGLGREDALLFEVRHYEILREVVVSADLVLKQVQEQDKGVDSVVLLGTLGSPQGAYGSLVDLSSLVSAINSLWTSTGRLLYPASSAGATDKVKDPSTPAVPAASAAPSLSMNKSSSLVALQLDRAMDQLCSLWAENIHFPLKVLLDQKSSSLDAAKFQSTYQALETCIESVAEEKVPKMDTWIEDQEIRRRLMENIVVQVEEKYQQFLELGRGLDAPSPDQVAQKVRKIFLSLVS